MACSNLYQFALVENGNPMAERRDGQQVMGNKEDAGPHLSAKLAEDVQDFFLCDQVERASAFVC